MYTSQKDSTTDEGVGKYISKSGKKKLQLIDFSKDKISALQIAATYASTSSKNISKNINWQESEWPELPKPGTSSSCPDSNLKLESQLIAGSSSSQCESSSKNGDKNSNQAEGTRGACDKKNCVPEKHIQKCEMKSIWTVQNHVACTSTELEDITCSLTALKMSNICQQPTLIKSPKIAYSQQDCLEKKFSQTGRKGKKLQVTFIENESHSKVNQKAFLTTENEEKTSLLQGNDEPALCDDNFPDLLTIKKNKKGKTKYSPPVDDITTKTLIKKYPKRTDPIFINLGEVLEHSSISQDWKNLLRNKYSTRLWSGKTHIDTSRRVIKRGKQREFPKRKTPTKLKVAILRGRQQKLKSRLQDNENSSNQSACAPDFFLSDHFKTPQSAASSKNLTSLEDRQTLQKEGSDLTEFFGHCSSDVNPLDSQRESDLKEIDLKTAEQNEELRTEKKLYSLTVQSSSSRYCPNEVLRLAKSSIHTRKFREYCNNDNSAALQEKVKFFLKQIYRFQTNSHFRDADKARIHRRYVLGLREAEKYFKLRKLKVLIVATDLESNLEEGGLDEIIENMKNRAYNENIPLIFALKRRDLAYCVFRKVPVSCMAVLNYEGAEELYRAMIDSWREAAAAYDEKLKEKQVILFAEQDSKEKPRIIAIPLPAVIAEATTSVATDQEL